MTNLAFSQWAHLEGVLPKIEERSIGWRDELRKSPFVAKAFEKDQGLVELILPIRFEQRGMEVRLVLWTQPRSADARLLQRDGFRSAARSGILVPVKIGRSKYDADGKLKNGVFKERYKDGALACVGKFCDGEKVGVRHRQAGQNGQA